jgi:DNA-binding CsgD family transcriptional regulator
MRDLSRREKEVLILLAEGQSNKAVAERLGLSVRTIEAHRARVMIKLELESLGELIKYALRNALINRNKPTQKRVVPLRDGVNLKPQVLYFGCDSLKL